MTSPDTIVMASEITEYRTVCL